MDEARFEPPGAERRNYVRVDDRLPILYRVLTPNEWGYGDPALWFKRVWNSFPLQDPTFQGITDSEPKDQIYFRLISDLHRKMDILVELLGGGQPGSLVQLPEMLSVSLSASGIRMPLSEACRLGDRIALCLVLPELPPANLFITGEVSRIEPIPGKETGYETGIRFLDLKGEEQDLLVRYIFRKLRKELRGNKNPAYEPSIPS